MKDCTSRESCDKPNLLCAYPDCARGEYMNSNKSANPLEGFGIISKQQWDEAQAEIERLKAELELRTRVVEVADEFVKRCELGEVRSVRTYAKFKEALAHLARRGE